MEALTPLYSSLPLPKEMNAWDRRSVQLGIFPDILMENAARAALEVLRGHTGSFAGKRVLAFMGAGNNGGDAVALARHLHDEGASVLLVHIRPLGEITGLSRRFTRVARKLGLPFISAYQWLKRGQSQWREAPHVIIDGLLGTGFQGELRPLEAQMVSRINELRENAFILALDVPSGLNAITGKPCPRAVRAHATVSFQAAKPGLALPQARAHTGALHVKSIGIPLLVQKELPASWLCLNLPTTQEPGAKEARFSEAPLPVPGLPPALLPAPAPSPAHKGQAGHVLVLGGSPGLGGAARLAAWAALRAGAGLVTLAALDAGQGNPVEADIMTLPLPLFEDSPQYARHCLEAVKEKISSARVRALVLGPGLGRLPAARVLAAEIIQLPGRPPLVLDADALAVLEDPACRAALTPADVLTPHPGEAAHLLGITAEALQADRFAALSALTALAPAAWVLKGVGTLMAQSGLPSVICPHDVPQLAVAGSGDVLAGLCGALLARGQSGLCAAALAVGLHVLAGQALAADFPCRGNTSRDIANSLPMALKRMRFRA